MHPDRKTRPPARRHRVACWVFDLDNTLYPAHCDLFAQIDLRMTEYISDLLGVDAGRARTVQKDYYRRYGTTLRGLMREHGADPEAYLAYVHDIDLAVLPPAPGLDRSLARLDGQKVVFTNGSAAHAARVLERLGVSRHFDRIFDIRSFGWVPKPEPEPYDHLLGELALAGPDTVLFEDSRANLRPAAERGMTTVWVRHGREDLAPGAAAADDPWADHVTDDLAGWLAALVAAAGGEADDGGGGGPG